MEADWIKQLPYKNFDNNIEKIRAHYLNEKVILTKHEEKLRLRFEAAFSLLCNYHSNEQAVPVLMKQFTVSKAQAYRDLRNAQEIFGDVFQSKKEAARYILYEMAMKNYQLAASGKPPDVDQMNKAVANMIKIKGLDKDEVDLPDASKIQPPIQILQINIDFITSQFANIIDDKAKTKINQLLGQINNIIEKGRVNDYLDSAVEVPMIAEKDAD